SMTGVLNGSGKGVVVLLIVGFNVVSVLRRKPELVEDVEVVVPVPGKPTKQSRSQETLPSYETAMGEK
ncbi:hypothetical protein FRC11_005823, partial [Ceratobasidium sp. 423]